MLALLIVLLGCSEQGARVERAVDPATDSAREARRREFLADQDSQLKAHVTRRLEFFRSERLRAEVFLVSPTLIAFYPSRAADADSAVQGAVVQPARTAAAEVGWIFDERWSGEIKVRDPDWQAQYWVRPHADSVGLLLLSPGEVPEILYGAVNLGHLQARLRERSRGPSGRESAGRSQHLSAERLS